MILSTIRWLLRELPGLKRTLFLKFAIPIVTALATAISAYFITR